MKIKEFEVGRPAYILRCNGYDKFDDAPTAVDVTKVGRKLVTVRVGAWDRKFEVPFYDRGSECLVEKSDYGEKSLLFPTLDGYNAWRERRELLQWFMMCAMITDDSPQRSFALRKRRLSLRTESRRRRRYEVQSEQAPQRRHPIHCGGRERRYLGF